MDPTSQEAILESLETLSHAKDYYRWLSSRVRPFIRGKVLEIGAGIGNFAQWGRETASEYHVSDIDPRLTQKLSEQFENVFCWDIYTPFPNNELYDTVVILNVVEHLEDDKKAVQCLNARLKPGGKLILMVPAIQLLYGTLDHSFGHFRRYTKKSISQLIASSGFTILECEYVNVIGLFGWFLYGKILKRKILPSQLCSRFDLMIPLLKVERPIAHFMGLSVIAVAQKNPSHVPS
jgi:2-polyprenyl-3-methyl-5-hydroxy-6-metoxy-1,4-benzoquinol methylase